MCQVVCPSFVSSASWSVQPRPGHPLMPLRSFIPVNPSIPLIMLPDRYHPSIYIRKETGTCTRPFPSLGPPLTINRGKRENEDKDNPCRESMTSIRGYRANLSLNRSRSSRYQTPGLTPKKDRKGRERQRKRSWRLGIVQRDQPMCPVAKRKSVKEKSLCVSRHVLIQSPVLDVIKNRRRSQVIIVAGLLLSQAADTALQSVQLGLAGRVAMRHTAA